MTAVKAFKKNRMNYTVTKEPLFVTLPVPGASGVMEQIQVENKFALVRQPTKDDPQARIFGYAGERYGIIQNKDLAKMIDLLTEKWELQTVGALGYGETVFATLDAGMDEIGGEEIGKYFSITDTKDGATAGNLLFGATRIVCQNTFDAALSGAKITASLIHHEGIQNEMKYRLELMAKLQKAEEISMALFKQMAEVILTPDDLSFVWNKVFPQPKRRARAQLMDSFEGIDVTKEFASIYAEAEKAQAMHEYNTEYAEKMRERAGETLSEMNADNGKLANTAWYAFHAITALADHRNSNRGDGTQQAISSLFGNRAKEKRTAFKAIQARIS
jgi:hypothetical protein